MSSIPVSVNFVRKLADKPGTMEQLDAVSFKSSEADIAGTNRVQHDMQPALHVKRVQQHGLIYCYDTHRMMLAHSAQELIRNLLA